MEADVRLGRLAEPDADLAAEMYNMTDETLSAAGFAQYEISNWARPGHESRHNLVYWRGEAWEAVGPGAHRFELDLAGVPSGRYTLVVRSGDRIGTRAVVVVR